jgi:hypothetical protein
VHARVDEFLDVRRADPGFLVVGGRKKTRGDAIGQSVRRASGVVAIINQT